MIIFRQKEFGNNANKQANRDFIINQGLKDSKASKRLEKIKNSEEHGFFKKKKKEKRKDQISKLEDYLESKTTKDNILRKYRESNKDVQNLSTPKERLASLDPSKRKELKKRINARKLAKEIEERELFESAQREKAEQIRQEASQKALSRRLSNISLPVLYNFSSWFSEYNLSVNCFPISIIFSYVERYC